MFKIQDGRENFVQWDLNRKIFVEDESITQVHFANLSNQNALVTEVKNHLADVPNVLLQDYGTILIYGCDDNYTKYSEAYRVLRREKPDNYVYTETEVLNYNNLLGRIDNLEGNIDKIIADYLRENPPQVDLNGYATKEYVDNAIAAINLSNYFTKEEANSKFATKEEIPSTSGLATEQYVNEAIAGIQIPEGAGIKHITITDATELLSLEDGLYIVDNEFTVNALKGEYTFSGALSVKQDWQNYTFIDYNAYLLYNDGDQTWDYNEYAFQENIENLQEQIDNSGFQTEEQVQTTIGNTLSGLGYQNRSEVQTIVTQMVPTLDIDASQVKHIKGNPNSGWVLERGEYTLQELANVFDNEFKVSASSLTTAQKNIVNTAINTALTNSGFQTETQVNTLISNAISAIGVAEGGTY